MVAIYHSFYNFCRVHQTLRVTPAMESGIADHIWSVTELVSFDGQADCRESGLDESPIDRDETLRYCFTSNI
jgi:hypothetical protein